MRIDYSEIRESVETAAIEKKTKELMNKGYEVNRNTEVEGYLVDLLATKDNEKIIYKFVKKKAKVSKTTYERIQKLARKAGAKFRIIYIVPPAFSGLIEFDDLENVLLEDIKEKVDILPNPESVSDVIIDKVTITRQGILVTGNALVEDYEKETLYGFNYSLKLNNQLMVEKSEYEFLSNA